ncbi:MAG: acetate kinase [Bacillota bacterium]|nr:acetate kinase [Bacillota bacterium]
MIILVVNAGSSSLKYQLMDSEDGRVLAKGLAERIGINGSQIKYSRPGAEQLVEVLELPNHSVAMQRVLELLTSPECGVVETMDAIDAVGHRVVHGGERFAGSCLIDAEVVAAIRAMIPLSPLHNPPNLAGIQACRNAMPGKPQVAVFDTAFHQTMPAEAYMYALPYSFYAEHGVRRYGFHGTSHQYVAERAIALMGLPLEESKIVTCHLGNGSSITAVRAGRSIDTTMGMTPLAGVPMGTRCGDIDPAIIRFMMNAKSEDGLDIDRMDRIMNHESGVLGISGVSSDFRDLYAAADEGNKRAQLALDMFIYQVAKSVGAYAAAMNGLNGLVFTAGIGENTPALRAAVCERLGYLGIEIDAEANARRGEEVLISTADSRVRVYCIPTNEELMIAKDTARLATGV